MQGICPACGGKTINGVCLNCGMTTETGKKFDESSQGKKYGTDAQDLADVKNPDVFTMSGEEVKPAPPRRETTFINPYDDVIPYEKPDFGENYIPPSKIIKENGIPKSVEYDSGDAALLPSQRVRLKSGRSIKEYWWIILFSVVLPWFICWVPALPLLRFDEKGGRKAGVAILILSAVKIAVTLLVFS